MNTLKMMPDTLTRMNNSHAIQKVVQYNRLGNCRCFYFANRVALFTLAPDSLSKNRQKRRQRHSVSGATVIYVIRAKNTDLYKVGKTKNIQDRLYNLQSSCPFPLELVIVKDGYSREEVLIHQVLIPYHHHGEWYKLDTFILEWITQVEFIGVRKHEPEIVEIPAQPMISLRNGDAIHVAAFIEIYNALDVKAGTLKPLRRFTRYQKEIRQAYHALTRNNVIYPGIGSASPRILDMYELNRLIDLC